MKAERDIASNTLRGTLLLKMAISRTLAKHRVRHLVEGSCLHLSQIDTSIIKKLKERAFSLPGKLPAPSILLSFSLRFGSGSPLPLINACYSGDFRILIVRFYRQNHSWLMASSRASRRPHTWRRTAAIASSVLYVS